MESPEVWRWIWLVTAFVFVAGEMTVLGTFFLLPFAVGAGLAAGLAFADVGLGWQWLAFVLAAGGAFAVLYPLGRRLDRGAPEEGIGAKRLIGQTGVVLEDIPGGPAHLGLVRVGREEWRAESVDDSTAIPAGSAVRVVEVRGTRLIVWPVAEAGLSAASQENE